MRTPIRTSLLTLFAVALGACRSSSDPPPASPPPPPPPPTPGVVGLDARPGNTTCIAPPRPTNTVDVELVREYATLSFSQPLGMMQAPGDASRWFVLEKTGRVRVIDVATSSFLADFIDLNSVAGINLDTDSEGGLLGMAFHPSYPSNGQVFLSWTDVGTPMTSIIARFTVNPGGLTLNTGSRTDILQLEQDFENHNGGNIAFGPDDRLYIGFGDGGSGGDPLNRAQETRNMLGDLLRIDINSGTPYAIPPDNPFAGGAVCPTNPDLLLNDCPEIYASGLRNPWRFSFDRVTGELWLGDVGQGAREEIDLIERGGNYGWDCREGNLAHGAAAPSCATTTGFVSPVHDYPRSEGVSVTGGFVYRGDDIPELYGNYLFADFGSGRLWRLVDNGAGGFSAELLLATGLSISSFGEAADGELYLVHIGATANSGSLHRIARGTGSGATNPIPDRLSATGCMSSGDPSQPGPALIPYSVQAPFWSDGAAKERWLALPNGTSVTLAADGDFTFPTGSVLVKQFRLGGALVETRLLMRHTDGSWAGYSYEWDAALNDGVLVDGGRIERIGNQDWIYPSTGQCDICHTAAAGRTLGLEIQQLNGSMTYAATGRTANQLATLGGIGVLANPVGDPATLPSLSDPYIAGPALAARARSWLHTNCAQCHRPGGPTASDLDLRFATALGQTNACNVAPTLGTLGLGPAARILVPGNAGLSVLVARIGRRDANGMPPLASHLVDTAGLALIESWIAGLNSCV